VLSPKAVGSTRLSSAALHHLIKGADDTPMQPASADGCVGVRGVQVDGKTVAAPAEATDRDEGGGEAATEEAETAGGVFTQYDTAG
jgi:hypothetical protein